MGKVIWDIVHGYISVSNNVVKIIDHPSFQRLKHISQLTAQHLFPSANHTRFEHSVGVMYLAEKYIDSIRQSLFDLDITNENYNFYKFHLSYAALLHDIGHAPLSHVGENFYNLIELEEKINDNIEGSSTWISKGSPHEKMSCYVISENFKDLLKQIFDDKKVELDMEFIFRIITGTKYDRTFWEKNLIIEIINSNSIDVDKLDYLIRDNYMVGGLAPSFDLDRFLKSLTIDDMKKISYKASGLSSLISIIDCRDYLYIWLYNHHTIVYTDYLYQTEIEHLLKWKEEKNNPYEIDNYISCDSIAKKLFSDTDVYAWLNNEYQYQCQLDTEDKYSKTILSQILSRKFLKPLWKSIFEYNTFMQDNFNDRQRKEILEFLIGGSTKEERDNTDKNRRKIVKKIQNESKIEPGDIFIIERSNKFYASNTSAEFYVYISGKQVEIRSLIPMRNFDKTLSNIAFYIFAPNDKIDQVKQDFIRIMKDEIS